MQQFAVLSYAPLSVSSETLAYPKRRFPDYNKQLGEGRVSEPFDSRAFTIWFIFHCQTLNHPNSTCGLKNTKNYCITDLTSYVKREDITEGKPDKTFLLNFDNYVQNLKDVFGNGKYNHFMSKFLGWSEFLSQNWHFHISDPLDDLVLVGAINNISLTYPSFPPLTQPEKITEKTFCSEGQWPEECLGNPYCFCSHRLKVQKDDIVEFFIIDTNASKFMC